MTPLLTDGYFSISGNTTATNAANESLQTTLARLNAKLAALETENSLLQGASSQARALAKEKASVMKQHAALQKVGSYCVRRVTTLGLMADDLQIRT